VSLSVAFCLLQTAVPVPRCWHRAKNISKRGISVLNPPEQGIFAQVVPSSEPALGSFRFLAWTALRVRLQSSFLLSVIPSIPNYPSALQILRTVNNIQHSYLFFSFFFFIFLPASSSEPKSSFIFSCFNFSRSFPGIPSKTFGRSI